MSIQVFTTYFNFLNNKGPTLAETHLPGQLAKSNDRKIACEMKQTLPLSIVNTKGM